MYRIREAAAGGDLLRAPKLLLVVGEWARWGDLNHVRAWFDAVRDDDQLLAQLLLASRSEHLSKRRRYYRLNPAWFERYVAKEELADDIRRMLSTSPPDDVRETGEQFLRELKMLETGRNPDGMFDSDWNEEQT